jgi:hypothetical protein
MVNDVLIRSDAGHKQLSEYSRPVERELVAGAEHLEDCIHDAFTLILKSHGYDDEGDYAKNPANYKHHVVVSEPIGITLSKEEEEIYKAFITGEQHD